MAGPFDPRVNDNPSTYFVQDRKNKKEFTRLMLQDQMITASMGGVLPEQADPTLFRQVLDVACGTGDWSIKAAQTYPAMSLVGIDISQRMIDYARAQAKTYQVTDRIEYCVMDALSTLDFPTASFDLVNLRFGSSFVRTWDWPKVITELLRVTRPGGIVRVTDTEALHQSNAPMFMQLSDLFLCAFFRAGHLFEQARTGLTAHLPHLLNQYGCEQVQTKAYSFNYRAGTAEGEAYYENVALFFQTIRPFIQKWGCASKNYETTYQQVLVEMHQPDFLATVNLLTVWGSKL